MYGRPEVMDPAVLRPGRFGKHIYVSLPNRDERGLILKALARKKPIDPSVDLSEIGRLKALENFSGADLSALVCQLINILKFSFCIFTCVRNISYGLYISIYPCR